MLLSEPFAIAIRDHWQVGLKTMFPIITRLSVRPDISGGVLAGYYLEMGVRRRLTPAEKNLLNQLLDPSIGGAAGLFAPVGAPGGLTVRVVTTGPMRLLQGGTWTGDVEPLRGGHRIGAVGGSSGTLGAVVRLTRDGQLDTTNKFILSCWHVLDREEIEWPAISANTFSKRVGSLYWSELSVDFDAAVGLVDSSAQVEVGQGFAWDVIGPCPARPSNPSNMSQAVLVCGHETQTTTPLQSTSATIWVDFPNDPAHMFTNQIQTDAVCESGDSGALLFLKAGRIPIGMAFADNDPDPLIASDLQRGTFYNNLHTLFAKVFHNVGWNESFQLTEILVDPPTKVKQPKLPRRIKIKNPTDPPPIEISVVERMSRRLSSR